MFIAHVQHFMHGRCGDHADETAKGIATGSACTHQLRIVVLQRPAA